jgi:hypothetical protein
MCLAEERAERRPQTFNERIHLQDSGPVHLLATDGEELSGELRGTRSGFEDGIEALKQIWVRADPRELPHRLQVLGLSKLLFEFLVFREVFGHHLHGNLARLVHEAVTEEANAE